MRQNVAPKKVVKSLKNNDFNFTNMLDFYIKKC